MAKSPTIRVYQLAKELGVESKEIVARCQQEEIPNITNHMSTVSIGLAETIREWYGGDGPVVVATEPEQTSVDTAKSKPRAKKKAARKKKVVKSTAPPESAASTPETEDHADLRAGTAAAEKTGPTTQPDEAATEDTTDSASSTKATQPAAAAEAAEGAGAAEVDADTDAESKEAAIASDGQSDEHAGAVKGDAQGQDDESPDDAATAAPAARTEPVENVPRKPESVKPAGPMLQEPRKVKLSGPTVIRVEKPDVVPAPSARGPRRDSGMNRGGPRSGRGVSSPAEGAAEGPRGRGASRRNKRRSASARDDSGRPSRTQPSEGSTNWREQDLLERQHRLNRSGGFFRAHRRDNLKRSSGSATKAATPAEMGGKVKIAEPITIKDLSAATGVKSADILKKLFLAGKPVTINSVIDAPTAIEVMLEYDIELEVDEQKSATQQIAEEFKTRDMVDERPRSPVVTILGHVDHGKTSLLDHIRSANVAEGEAGGITQATSAFQVPVHAGDKEHLVTFIDTPGHEAFTEMRSRGAKVTDVIVLVVAADDGVMPQTVESINHAKAAGVPIIVALNKIDKPEATDSNIQRILGQLAEHELNPVEWGGSTEVVRTSAIKGEGIQDVLELLDYQAELLDLKADFGGQAQGTVLEASMQEGRGPVANVLIEHGTLKKGDFIVVGRAYGRVRDMINDHGERIEAATPSMPVAISGMDEVPDAGDSFYVVKSLRDAEASAQERRQKDRERGLAREKVTLDNIFEKLAESDRKELPLIVKGDVQGSVDTLRATLTKISTDDIAIAIKHAAVGGINESDVLLAETSGAIVIGFNVTAPGKVRKLAEAKGVDIRLYDVIYDITDDVKKAAEGLLDPEHKLEVLGHAEVREVFKVSKVGMVAGCYVTDGVVERNAQIRVTRDDIVIEKDRKLEQLKRFKDDAKEVRAGQECGMKIEGYDDIKVGDVLECYKTLVVRRTL